MKYHCGKRVFPFGKNKNCFATGHPEGGMKKKLIKLQTTWFLL